MRFVETFVRILLCKTNVFINKASDTIDNIKKQILENKEKENIANTENKEIEVEINENENEIITEKTSNKKYEISINKSTITVICIK